MSYNNDSVSLPSQSNKLHAPGSVSEITRISLPVLNLAYNLNNALKSTIEEIKKVNSSVPIELEVFYSPLVLSLLRPQKLQTRREKRKWMNILYFFLIVTELTIHLLEPKKKSIKNSKNWNYQLTSPVSCFLSELPSSSWKKQLTAGKLTKESRPLPGLSLTTQED